MSFRKKLYKAVAVLFLVFAAEVSACPEIEGLVDYNCDGQVKVFIVGDSIVYGTGDTVYHKGGYVRRVKKLFNNVKFNSMGIPGVRTYQLLRDVQGLRRQKNRVLRESIQGSDIVIIDVGRNDFWDHLGAATTVNYIERIAKTLKQALAQNHTQPYVVVATLLPTTRYYQVGFIKAVNQELLRRNSENFPVLLRYDNLPNWILNYDGLHPNGYGYDRIAGLLKRSLPHVVAKNMRALRPDEDVDGCYDRFELSKYTTDPTLFDTDGDGAGDGDELFTAQTDPLDPEDFPEPSPTATPEPEETLTPEPTPEPTEEPIDDPDVPGFG